MASEYRVRAGESDFNYPALNYVGDVSFCIFWQEGATNKSNITAGVGADVGGEESKVGVAESLNKSLKGFRGAMGFLEKEDINFFKKFF